jgi:hypothetical protein
MALGRHGGPIPRSIAVGYLSLKKGVTGRKTWYTLRRIMNAQTKMRGRKMFQLKLLSTCLTIDLL